MFILDNAIFIHHQQGRHAAQFYKLDLLVINIGHTVFGVGQAYEGKFLNFPIALIKDRTIRPDCKDFRVTRGKGLILVAKAGEMGAAIRSAKPAQESKDNMFFAFVL